MFEPPADVTDQVLARPDAHPLKDHDLIVAAQGRHVKVRTVEHPLSTPDQPYYVATYALAEPTGKARRKADGTPAIYGGAVTESPFAVATEGEHHIVVAGEAPAAEPGHPAQEEPDYGALIQAARLRMADRVARLDRAREEIGRIGRVKRLDQSFASPPTSNPPETPK